MPTIIGRQGALKEPKSGPGWPAKTAPGDVLGAKTTLFVYEPD